ncbi:hypothetical protein [Desulfosporosinus sp. BG]|uniref:hypothetical protein n=1 Tax=Desulfosporosinus sp. BG TaxID=1633135 RepID=UPI000856BBB8|nr:hypothetical protein [Desulfosporosinus sp. BG]ODA39297.1 hypothetical protein DSBG_3901 [Desulfosporosinus sp. BG]
MSEISLGSFKDGEGITLKKELEKLIVVSHQIGNTNLLADVAALTLTAELAG